MADNRPKPSPVAAPPTLPSLAPLKAREQNTLYPRPKLPGRPRPPTGLLEKLFAASRSRFGEVNGDIVVTCGALSVVIALSLTATTLIRTTSLARIDLSLNELTFTVPSMGDTRLFDPVDLTNIVLSDIADVGFTVATTGRVVQLHRFGDPARCGLSAARVGNLQLPPDSTVSLAVEPAAATLTVKVRQKPWLEWVTPADKAPIMCTGLAENSGRTMTRPLPTVAERRVSFVTGTNGSMSMHFEHAPGTIPTTHDADIDPHVRLVRSSSARNDESTILDSPQNVVSFDGRTTMHPRKGELLEVSGPGPMMIRSLTVGSDLDVRLEGWVDSVLAGPTREHLTQYAPTWFDRYRHSLLAIMISLLPAIVGIAAAVAGRR